MRNRIAVALAPTLEAVANAFVALASSTSPIAQAFDAVLANLDRLAIYAGTLAAFLAGRWVAGLAAAALSVRGLATALAFLRGALVRTGIGALIVGAGELVYWFTRLIEGAGGFGEAMGLLKDVAVEVWERIRMGAYAAVDPIPGTGAPIVALANQTGATLATEGWAPDRLVLRARDLVSLGSEDSTRLYQVTGDVTSSATGAATLALAPRLRRAPPQFAPLNVSAPQVVLRLTEPVPTRIGRADSYRFSVTAREAL